MTTLTAVSLTVPAPDAAQLVAALTCVIDTAVDWYPDGSDGRSCRIPLSPATEIVVYELDAAAATPRSLTLTVADADANAAIQRLTDAGFSVQPPRWREKASVVVAGVLIRLLEG